MQIMIKREIKLDSSFKTKQIDMVEQQKWVEIEPPLGPCLEKGKLVYCEKQRLKNA